MKVNLKEIKKRTMHVLSGSILTEDIIMKNIRFLFVVFVIVVLYISNRYSCISKMAEIQSLQKELKDVKYESLNISTELIGISRESQVQALVEKNGLNLEIPKDPIYRIEK
ncbi:MAG: FtsL-like putative cell division protein [Dysgonomonas sp.]